MRCPWRWWTGGLCCGGGWHGRMSAAAVQVRVPLSKDERKRLKAARRSGLAGGSVLDDFADDVAGVLQLGEASKGFTDKLRLGQQFGGALPADTPCQIGGGTPSCAARRSVHTRMRAVPPPPRFAPGCPRCSARAIPPSLFRQRA